jgi:RNA polymerase sigma-70 factor (ECF subfamily)
MELERCREVKPVSEQATFSRGRTTTARHARRESAPPTVKSIYEEYARFVWLTLQRFGVKSTDVADVAHDVFVVVHRRIDTFDNTSRMTTWLFGICLRVAANYRRRQARTLSEVALRAHADDDVVQVPVDEILARRQATADAERVLAKLSLEKRAVFVMFELENLSCQEIADLTGVPIGTVYSRLYGARAQIQRIISQTSK